MTSKSKHIGKRVFFILVLMLISVYSPVRAEALSFVGVHFAVENSSYLTEGDVVFSIYDGYNDAFLDTQVYNLKRGTTEFDIVFSVPEYSVGKTFFVRLVSGAKSLTYGSATDKVLVTVSNENSANSYPIFNMALQPNCSKQVIFKVDGVPEKAYGYCVMNNKVFVTTDLLRDLCIDYKYNPGDVNPHVVLSSQKGSYRAYFYMNNIYARVGSREYNLPSPCFELYGTPFVPLEDVAIYFACSYYVESDNGYVQTVSLKKSAYKLDVQADAYVNTRDITSKTDYMIWVSKSNYAVNVYKGSTGNWAFIKSFPCAIGAPSSPTVEGSFEYYQYQDMWKYDKFYCGPVMRFYNGYALHSTLIKYNGAPYDSRVGMKISHGCVRIPIDGMNWLVKNIPLYTRILVTK